MANLAMFAQPVVAISFGAFILCAETCLHAADIIALSTWTDLPLNDWFAGGFLVYGGLTVRRSGERGLTTLAAAWGFMCSLLVAAFLDHWTQWEGASVPSDEWIPEGAFLAILSALMVISALGLFATVANGRATSGQ